MTRILRGRPVADALIEDAAARAADMERAPSLAIVRIGARPVDLSYERSIRKKCEAAGVRAVVRVLPNGADESSFRSTLAELDADDDVDAILPFRPLPPYLSQKVLYEISPVKDVDCASPLSTAAIYDRSIYGAMPCTAEAVLAMFDHYDIGLSGVRVAIIGRSYVVGRALALLLTDRDATISLCHSKTNGIEQICLESDIVISACGRPRYITSALVRQGAVVIDVGINVDAHGVLCGDADKDELIAHGVEAISPVPGGVGAITSAVLVRNVVNACAARRSS